MTSCRIDVWLWRARFVKTRGLAADLVERMAARIGYELHYEDGGAATDHGVRARILAANQAEAISDRNIHVIPTKTLPQCIAAMLVFDPEADWETNLEQMNEAIGEVKTGEITYAIRDTKINGLKIVKNNIIGLTGGEIVAKGKSVDQVAEELLDKMVDEDTELISLYYGNDVTEDEAAALSDKLEQKYEDCDFEVSFGGQPLYYYIISVE